PGRSLTACSEQNARRWHPVHGGTRSTTAAGASRLPPLRGRLDQNGQRLSCRWRRLGADAIGREAEPRLTRGRRTHGGDEPPPPVCVPSPGEDSRHHLRGGRRRGRGELVVPAG